LPNEWDLLIDFWFKSTLLLKLNAYDTAIYMKQECLPTKRMKHYSCPCIINLANRSYYSLPWTCRGFSSRSHFGDTLPEACGSHWKHIWSTRAILFKNNNRHLPQFLRVPITISCAVKLFVMLQKLILSTKTYYMGSRLSLCKTLNDYKLQLDTLF